MIKNKLRHQRLNKPFNISQPQTHMICMIREIYGTYECHSRLITGIDMFFFFKERNMYQTRCSHRTFEN